MSYRWSAARLGSRRTWLAAGAAASGVLLLAACGSSSSTASAGAGSTGSSASSTSSSAPATSAGSGGQQSGITIKTASVTGYGTVLVDGSGKTLYMLTSEQGGKITCTDANGCTKIWPDTELPDGVMNATAGPEIQTSLLSTVKDAAGHLYVTYNSWPLYTFSRDTGPGMANGEGINSFGGTWYVLDASGNPVKSSQSNGGSAPASNSYGY